MQHISVPTVSPILNGSVPALVTFLIDFTNAVLAAGTAVKKCTIRADTKNPVLIETSAEVIAVITGTAPQFTVGTTSANANEILAAGDVTEATPGFYPANNALKRLRVTADTAIWIKYVTGGGSAGGSANLMLRITPLAPIQT